MANQEHAKLLQQGRGVWNAWRKEHPDIKIDLYRAHLNGADLSRIDLTGANLREANLSEANLSGTYLEWANLSGANLSGAHLTGCFIHAISAWNVQLDGAIQSGLIITPYGEPTITIESLEFAQFIYLLLNNTKMRDVIDTMAKKAVLILGRFNSERKAVLYALKESLRHEDYLPIVFDFEKPSSRDLTETVLILAHLSRFVIIDLTSPSSTPHEAASVIPLCKIPIQPIIEETGKLYAMFSDFKLYPWVLNLYRYKDANSLLTSLREQIIKQAEKKAEELEELKNNNFQ